MITLNKAALQELVDFENEGRRDLITRLIQTYVRNSLELVHTIETSARSGDYRLLELSAHSLKSSSQLLGLETVGAYAKKIEDQARTSRQYDPVLVASLKEDLVLGHQALLQFDQDRP